MGKLKLKATAYNVKYLKELPLNAVHAIARDESLAGSKHRAKSLKTLIDEFEKRK